MTLVLSIVAAVAGVPAPTLTSEGDAAAGFVRLAWERKSPELTYQLQTAGDPSFRDARTIYEGHAGASFRSGLGDGNFYYRVRAGGPRGWGAWSRPVHFAVRHHSASITGALFGLGAVVFGLTAAFLVHSSRSEA